MWKIIGGFIGGLAFSGIMAFSLMSSLMFNEHESPFGVEETVARIQQNIQGLSKDKGWTLSGLRNPGRAVQNDGGNTLPVLMVEACSTKYSKPILNDDKTRILSILMPCKVSVYKKTDGKVYIGTMNAGLMGKFFGPTVAEIMGHVAADQKQFLAFDPSKPAPPMVLPKAGGEGGGSGGPGGGC